MDILLVLIALSLSAFAGSYVGARNALSAYRSRPVGGRRRRFLAAAEPEPGQEPEEDVSGNGIPPLDARTLDEWFNGAPVKGDDHG